MTRHQEDHYVMIRKSIHQEDTVTLTREVPNLQGEAEATRTTGKNKQIHY